MADTNIVAISFIFAPYWKICRQLERFWMGGRLFSSFSSEVLVVVFFLLMLVHLFIDPPPGPPGFFCIRTALGMEDFLTPDA